MEKRLSAFYLMIRLNMYDHFVISQEIMICELFKAIKCSRIELNLLDDALVSKLFMYVKLFVQILMNIRINYF